MREPKDRSIHLSEKKQKTIHPTLSTHQALDAMSMIEDFTSSRRTRKRKNSKSVAITEPYRRTLKRKRKRKRKRKKGDMKNHAMRIPKYAPKKVIQGLSFGGGSGSSGSGGGAGLDGLEPLLKDGLGIVLVELGRHHGFGVAYGIAAATRLEGSVLLEVFDLAAVVAPKRTSVCDREVSGGGSAYQLPLPPPFFLTLLGAWSVNPCFPKNLGMALSGAGSSLFLGISLCLWERVMVGCCCRSSGRGEGGGQLAEEKFCG